MSSMTPQRQIIKKRISLFPQTSRGDIWDTVIKPKQNLLLSERNKEVKTLDKDEFQIGFENSGKQRKNTAFHHLDSFKKPVVF